MKKLIIIGFLAITGFTLAGCDSTGRVEGDTKGYTRETITIGGDKFDCIFLNKGSNNGSMSCRPL